MKTTQEMKMTPKMKMTQKMKTTSKNKDDLKRENNLKQVRDTIRCVFQLMRLWKSEAILVHRNCQRC